MPVASGRRYQLVLFILTTEHADVPARLKAIGAAAGAKAAGKLMDVGLSTAALARVLTAWARHCPEVGYCQGLNTLAAMLLLVMPEETELSCCDMTPLASGLPPG